MLLGTCFQRAFLTSFSGEGASPEQEEGFVADVARTLARSLSPGGGNLQGVRVGEQRGLQGEGTAWRPGRVRLEPQRLQPPALAQRVQSEESPLRPAQGVRVLEEPRARHRTQLAGMRPDPDLVAGERLPGMFDDEALGRQCLLVVHPPMPEAPVAESVQDAHEARRDEAASQLFLAVPDPAGERRPSSRPACARWAWAL